MPRRKGAGSVTRPERLPEEQRAHTAIALRIKGHDWETVAERSGYANGHSARVAIGNRVRRTRAKDIEAMRELQTRRYEALLLKLDSRLSKPAPSYHALAEARAILGRIDAIYGLARLPAAAGEEVGDGQVRTSRTVTVEERVEVGAGILELMARLGMGGGDEADEPEAEDAADEAIPVADGVDLMIRRLAAENDRDGYEDDGATVYAG